MIKIEKALENCEFQAFYQPQYNSVTGKLVSAEALARWVRPDGTLVPPVEFIPIAEKTDLILKIDWYILNEVCKFLRKRKDQKHRCVAIAVNFSRKHVAESNFREKLCEIVDGYNLPRELIEVELTESAIMRDSEAIIKFVSDIRDEGFNVAIDDFGSGLSSLSLVKDISANVLKIDRSLLSGNCENEKERIVLESIFAFAHRLKLTTIAEGVETVEQLGFLRTCDCSLIQGFLFAKPMPEDEFGIACSQRVIDDYKDDILKTQAPASATNLLMEAVFTKFPLVIMSNITRNSYYMMTRENFSATSCPSTGTFDELIMHGAESMHPDDRELFSTTFSIPNLKSAYERGEKFVKVITQQLGDDGIYRKVETTDIFVKNPSVDDILIITLCQNID
ncbi:MAG: EAL domain-containing protein [Ruminococcus flavefaciens]|nr:EAL domain-containing protein [Ruminococcus flavefaciens]